MKEGYFCSQEKGKNLQKYFTSKKAKIRKSISQEKRQRFAKVFPKKRQRFAKVFKYSSIQKKYSNCFGSLQGDKKDMQVHNISISEQNCNDISKDLNTCGLHYPSATELRSREGEKPRPAKRVGRLWFCSTAPRLLLELDSSRIKRTIHILGTSTSTLSGEN